MYRSAKCRVVPKNILRLVSVNKWFGGLHALTDLDLDIAEGSIHSLIGPNGAGKTTVFNCITQFFPISSGQVYFKDQQIDGLRSEQVAALGLSRTYQNIRLFGSMTAVENVMTGMHMHLRAPWWGAILNTRYTRQEERKAYERASEILEMVGLSHREDMLSQRLSYGDQRRLEIARALATTPKLLLLDEPAAGMNPRESEDLMRFIVRLRDTLGITVLLIEHQMRMVMQMSDTVTVLDYGTKIAEGPPSTIREDRRVIEAYLGHRASRDVATLEL